MVVIVIIAALLGSFFNTISSVLQRRAAGSPNPRELFSRQFIVNVIKNRLWLIGEAFDLLGFCMQAIALKFGSLTFVEPLLATNLVMLLLILHLRYRLQTGWREWGGALAICFGIGFLLLIANPRGGHLRFDGATWAMTGAIIGAFVAVSATVVRHLPRPAWRAALAGVAAGVNFALTAAFTKLVVDQLDSGVGVVLSSWEVYALMVSGISALIVMQNAFGAGPLIVSSPAMQIFEPLVSVIIGILLFGDVINMNPIAILAELACGLTIGSGIVLLGGSKRVQQHTGL